MNRAQLRRLQDYRDAQAAVARIAWLIGTPEGRAYLAAAQEAAQSAVQRLTHPAP